MSRNYYCEINFHIVWHTKQSSPLLADHIELITHECLKKRIIDTPGAFIHAIGGTPTHVHLAVTVQPTLTPSEWIGQLKGGCAHDVNLQLGERRTALQWQTGYGIVSFGTGDLQWVIDYITHQRDHHAKSSVHDRLERISNLEA